jgi:transforming growth factor-beta-induced protein
MMPDIVDTAVGAGSFKTLAAALGAAGLVDTMKSPGPFTVFAPTDEAFAKLPAGTVEELIKPENKAKLTGILTYHVVSGKVMASTVVTMDGAKVPTVNGAEITIKVGTDGVMVDGAKVVTTDIECDNGVIHVIDSVILPAEKKPDIVDTAVAAGSFKTLAAALGAAGLVETMKSAGPFTVFAPTDDAFAKLPKGTVETLLEPENKAKLAAILTYHVVSGKVMASTVVTMDGKKVGTVNGAEATIKVGKGGVMVDKAKVVTTDIECSNGVIHVIDSVILPPPTAMEKALAMKAAKAAKPKRINTKKASYIERLKGPSGLAKGRMVTMAKRAEEAAKAAAAAPAA